MHSGAFLKVQLMYCAPKYCYENTQPHKQKGYLWHWPSRPFQASRGGDDAKAYLPDMKADLQLYYQVKEGIDGTGMQLLGKTVCPSAWIARASPALRSSPLTQVRTTLLCRQRKP